MKSFFTLLLVLIALCHFSLAQTCDYSNPDNCFAKDVAIINPSGNVITISNIPQDQEEKVKSASVVNLYDGADIILTAKITEPHFKIERKVIANKVDLAIDLDQFLLRDAVKDKVVFELHLSNGTKLFTFKKAKSSKTGNKNEHVGQVAFHIAKVKEDSLQKSGKQNISTEELKKITQEINSQSFTPGKVLSSISGIDVTNYADVMADVLANRIKEELTLAFIDKFKKTLNESNELKALLPQTYMVFNTSDPFKIPSFGAKYKQAFAEDMEELVYNFERLVYTEGSSYETLRSQPDFFAFMIAFRSIDLFGKGFHPAEILEVLDAQYGNRRDSETIQHISRYVRLMHLISKNLKQLYEDQQEADNGKPYWVSANEFAALSPTGFKIFVELLKKEDPDTFKNIKIKVGDREQSLYDLLEEDHAGFILQVKQFLTLSKQMHDKIIQYNNKTKDKDLDKNEKKELLINYFVSSSTFLLDIFDFGFGLPYYKYPEDYYKSKYYQQWRPVMANIISAGQGIYIKDYAKVALNSLSALNHLFMNSAIKPSMDIPGIDKDVIALKAAVEGKFLSKGKKEDIDKKIEEIESLISSLNNQLASNSPDLVLVKANKSYLDNAANTLRNLETSKTLKEDLKSKLKLKVNEKKIRKEINNFDKGIREDNMLIEHLLKNQELLKNLTLFTNFMTDILNAKTQDAMNEVINKYMAPVGSYQVKRNTFNSISINAYPGLFSGTETNFKTEQNWAVGITAPIGISFNWAFRKNFSEMHPSVFKSTTKSKKYKGLSGHSHSLFLNLVDIGALLSYRWDNDTNNVPGQITLGQIFSPGIFWVYGVKNAPISLKAGGQFVPELKSVSSEEITLNKTTDLVRFSVSVAVDIPVIHLSKKSKR